MKTTSGQKIKIGLFTIVGIAALIAAIFLIGNQKSLFNATFNVHGMFKNVNGLQVGNNVRFAGINVGVVDDITIMTDSSVKVTLTLNDDVKKFIKKDAKLSIGSDGLMGDKLVVIAPGGNTSNTPVNAGEQLAVVNPLDVDKIIGKFTKIADNAGDLVQGLATLVNKVNSGKGSIGRLLNNDKMARDMEGTVRQAKTTMANVHKTTTTLNEDLKAAQSNFLLKGFFNKKKKAKIKAAQDSIKKLQKDSTKTAKKAKDAAKQ
ncbi:MAG TPA: MlaD family protein [Mucilaginibacter sp.]|nr:MlaD family protein [Mucilaginibacter sp.]